MYEICAYPFGNKGAELLLYQPGNRSALVLSPKLTREVSKGGSLFYDDPRSSALRKIAENVHLHHREAGRTRDLAGACAEP